MPSHSSLHVGYVLKRFPRLSETFVLNELLTLERLGVRTTVFALGSPGEAVTHESLGRLRAEVCYAPRTSGSAASRLADTGRWIAEAARERGIRHLHAHFATSATDVAWAASLRSGLPFSFTAHAKDIYHESVDTRWLGHAIAASAFVVTVSDVNRQYLARLAGPAADRVCRIYNGVDLDQFAFVGGEDRSPSSVLAVGRFVEKKGFPDLIRAMALLTEPGGRPVSLTLVGTGEQEGEIRDLVTRLGVRDRVTLTGALPQERVQALMRSHTVFALPCLVGRDGNRDGLPTVILEAMASGLPVVSTDVNGVPEMITDGFSGRIVPQRSPSSLAGALGTLLAGPAVRAAMAARARETVEGRFRLIENVADLAMRFAQSARARSTSMPAPGFLEAGA